MVKALPKWRHSFSASGSLTAGNNSYSPVWEDSPMPSWALRPPRPTKPGIVVSKQPIRYQHPDKATAARDDVPTVTQSTVIEEQEQPTTLVEIQGMSLLEEREDSLKELQQANRIMYFHALQLIRKQKHWLEQAKKSSTLSVDPETIEQRKRALEDLESKIDKGHSKEGIVLSPEKALFKATALLEESVSCFFNRETSKGTNFQATGSAPEKELPPPTHLLRDDATLLKMYSDGDSCSDIYCDSTIRGTENWLTMTTG
jgi:hypothetical protein